VSYRILIARSAERELTALPQTAHQRVLRAILRLADVPRPRTARKLAYGPGWRLRVADYRVLYTIDDSEQEITVYAIGHRRDVYRR